jgi:hypothetical protein
MANRKLHWGIPGLLLIFCLILTVCKNDGDSGGGNGGGALNISGTWSKGSDSDERTLIISLTTGEWSSGIYYDSYKTGGIFILNSETNGSLKTGRSDNTGNAVLNGGKLYITGFFDYPSRVNGTYAKKSDDDDVGEYDNAYWT